MSKAPTHPLADAVAVYTDGGLLSSNPSPTGGTWAWVAVSEDGRKIGFKSGIVLTETLLQHAESNDHDAPRPVVSNNHTEQIAIIKAIQALPVGWSGTIYSDSEVAITRVNSDYELNNLGLDRFPSGEKGLWPSISMTSKEAVKRLGQIRFVLLQGHPTKKDLERGLGAKRNLPVSKWNVWADKRCEHEKKKFIASQIATIDNESKVVVEPRVLDKVCPVDFRSDATGVAA